MSFPFMAIMSKSPFDWRANKCEKSVTLHAFFYVKVKRRRFVFSGTLHLRPTGHSLKCAWQQSTLHFFKCCFCNALLLLFQIFFSVEWRNAAIYFSLDALAPAQKCTILTEKTVDKVSLWYVMPTHTHAHLVRTRTKWACIGREREKWNNHCIVLLTSQGAARRDWLLWATKDSRPKRDEK